MSDGEVDATAPAAAPTTVVPIAGIEIELEACSSTLRYRRALRGIEGPPHSTVFGRSSLSRLGSYLPTTIRQLSICQLAT